MEVNVQWNNPFSCTDVIDSWEVKSNLSKKGKILFKLFPTAIFWNVWTERNERIFEEKACSWIQVMEKIKLMAATWVEGKEEFRGISVEQIVVNWKEMFFDPP
ncbi:hypothetical protein BVC80_1513g8 [Macleaya cordata]|uniref:Uncharacterized protein n=1 Tax=Macleaya cordata TaxID=56857 RepID=A0A200PTF6_MACCD|nr:hypothetical protein BVC80_1513g8 [Macleaya cordata]